jgi:CRP-like cAMP-binding protein
VSVPLARIVATNPLFERLSPASQHALLPLFRLRGHDAGSTLLGPGDGDGGWTSIMAVGTARVVRRDAAGRTVAVGLLEPGDLFGPILGSSASLNEHVEALEPGAVLRLPASRLAPLLAREPLVARILVERLARRVLDGGDRLESLALRPVPARLALVLLDLAERRGRMTATGVQIGVRITHGGLADLVATTRETLTKVVGWLREEGIATHERRQILIHDVARLDAVASGVLVMPGRSVGPRTAMGPASPAARAS